MYIVIIGAGHIGYYLASLLLEEEHDVIIVERDEALCKKVSEELDLIVVKGDATEQKILEEAGIREADALVTLTGEDEANMIISLLAKDMGANLVAARIGKVEYDERVLKKSGVDIVIHPEAAAAGYIAELLTKPQVLDLAFFSKGKAEIMEIQINDKSKVTNKKIKEIALPPGSAIVAIIDDETLEIPTPETQIQTGQKLLVLAKRNVANEAKETLT